eukprot:5944426-Pyramimonas_sp.AAC.1
MEFFRTNFLVKPKRQSRNCLARLLFSSLPGLTSRQADSHRVLLIHTSCRRTVSFKQRCGQIVNHYEIVSRDSSSTAKELNAQVAVSNVSFCHQGGCHKSARLARE